MFKDHQLRVAVASGLLGLIVPLVGCDSDHEGTGSGGGAGGSGTGITSSNPRSGTGVPEGTPGAGTGATSGTAAGGVTHGGAGGGPATDRGVPAPTGGPTHKP